MLPLDDGDKPLPVSETGMTKMLPLDDVDKPLPVSETGMPKLSPPDDGNEPLPPCQSRSAENRRRKDENEPPARHPISQPRCPRNPVSTRPSGHTMIGTASP